MERRHIGTTGIEVSTISLGCWPMGGDYWGGADDEESIRTVHRALEGRREEAVISTKASGLGRSEEDLRSQLAKSLERLRTDRVDV